MKAPTIPGEKECCQAGHNCNPIPDPNLWNSTLGRRAFMKKTGAASAATLLALHSFKTEVLASASCPMLPVQVGTYIVYKKSLSFPVGDLAAQDGAWFNLGNSTLSQALAAGYVQDGGPIPIMEDGCFGGSVPIRPTPPSKLKPGEFPVNTPVNGIITMVATLHDEQRTATGAPCPPPGYPGFPYPPLT